MNDWLDYQGSGSSRACIAHSKLFGKDNEQTKADLRLLDAYAAKAYKLKDEYITLLNNYNTSMMMYHRYKRKAESQESKRAELAKSGYPLKATQNYESSVWQSKKEASDAKSEAESYLAQMKANIDAQKKLQADANELKVNMKKDSTRSLTTYDPKTIFIPDELPSNVNRRIKQSYFDIPADEFIMHAKKGGNSMNDWLDYAGSGSSRSYSNTIEHAAVSGRTTAPKPSNRNVPANNAYNILNSNLDQLYKSTRDLINLARNLRTSVESMISAARNAKKNLTLCEGKYKMWETAYNKIDSDIDAANISDMQKTALRNKLERISDGAGEIDKINTGYEIDINMDTFNNLISNIQNAMRR